MCSRTVWGVLTVAAVLANRERLLSQPALSGAAPIARLDALASRPGFGDTAPLPDRRGSPVETLEAVTGERDTESDREPDEIETDRDSFTPATTIAGRGRLIVESAYSFVDNRRIKETHSVPELILRYGLTERVELRLGWNYEVGGAGNEVSGLGAEDEDPTGRGSRLLREYTLSCGVKFRLTDQDRWRPRSAFILQGFTPTGSSTGVSTATQLIATYVAGWQFPNRWKFDAAIRYGTVSEDGDHFNQWAPSGPQGADPGEVCRSRRVFRRLHDREGAELDSALRQPGVTLSGDAKPRSRVPARLGTQRPDSPVLRERRRGCAVLNRARTSFDGRRTPKT
jgi:hypothetical protein